MSFAPMPMSTVLGTYNTLNHSGIKPPSYNGGTYLYFVIGDTTTGLNGITKEGSFGTSIDMDIVCRTFNSDLIFYWKIA